MPTPRRKTLACLGSLFVTCISTIRGSEVYLSRITIYKTHDRLFPPTVYFKCPDDNRPKRFLADVKATNHSYIVAPESVALTHLGIEYCQADCGIYDQDFFNEDDLFGSTFKLCDNDFDSQSHVYTVEVPGEVTLELYCPQCSYTAPPPPPPEVSPTGFPVPSGSIDANSTAGESELEKLLPSGEKLKKSIILVVVCAVLLGFFLGFLVHRCCRAFSDVAAEDARTRFQALYADPNTEIEDLPTSIPGNRNTGLYRFARSIRGILKRGNEPPNTTTPSRMGDAVPFHQLKVQEEELEIPDES